MSIARQYAYGMARLGWQHCDKCHTKLDYKINSIVWRCVEEDSARHLCPGCEAQEIAAKSLANLRAAFSAMVVDAFKRKRRK